MHLRQVFDDLEQFLGTYRGLVSRAGMVLPTEVTHPKGTILDLTIGLRDGLNLIRGRAGVVAVEDRSLRGPGRVNLVLRFVELDVASIDFIQRMQSREEAEGVPPFDLERRLSDPPRSLPEETDPPSPAADDSPPTGRPREDATTDRLGPSDPTAPDDELERAVAAALRDEPATADEQPSGTRPGRSRSRRRWVTWLLVLVVGIPAVILLGIRTGFIPTFHPVEALPPKPVAPAPSGLTLEPGSAPEEASPRATITQPTPALSAAGPAPSPTPPSPADGPATRLDDVVWTTLDGVTEVELIADRPLQPSQLRATTLSDPPRVLIRLAGVHRHGARYRQEVVDGRLEAIRVWHHAERHVVLDLADEHVLAGPPELVGRHARLRLVRAP